MSRPTAMPRPVEPAGWSLTPGTSEERTTTVRPNIKRREHVYMPPRGLPRVRMGAEVTMHRDGVRYYRYFGDYHYGRDPARSMQAACAWRDAIAAQYKRRRGGYTARDPDRTPAEVRAAADAAVDALAGG